jgi:hypothetical protein
MKKYLSHIANLLAVIVGLLALEAPLVTPAFIALGLGGVLDNALLQPIFIVFIIIAVYAQFKKVRETLEFFPIIFQFVIGIVGFLFIFPFRNLILGYLSLAGIVFLVVWPYIKKAINKRKVVKIKA